MAASDTSKEEETLEDDREAYKRAQDHEAINRRDALEDIRFARLGEQWPPEIRRQRERDARPCLTVNSLPAFIREVVNNARQNKPGINVHPSDSRADPQTAEILNGLIRQIEQSSDAEVAYDTALDSAVTGGWGYFRINTRYATDDTFDQDIVIERVANPLSVFGDPDSTAADSSDWMSAFEIDQVSKKAFKARWKDADAVSFDGDAISPDRSTDGADRVTIAARWIREDAPREIVAITMPDPMADPQQVAMAMQLGVSDSLIIDLDEYEANAELFKAIGMTVIGSPRTVPSFKVTQRILSGCDVLEEHAWGGKYIPLIPVYGEEVNVEGVRHFRGLVRDARDPQRNLNYWRSAATEMVALQSKAPWIGKKGAFETDGAKWDTANTQNWSFLEYDGADAPTRQPFAGIPAGAIQEASNASDDMKRILGMFTAPVSQDNESSGRALLARQKEGDTQSFHFIDNLSRAIRHGGRVILDLIPKVYSTQRILRIVKADGTQAAVQIAPQAQPEPDQAGAQNTAPPGPPPVGSAPPQPPQPTQGVLNPQLASQLVDVARIYDLTVGKYDLTVQAGPAYSTLREELNTVLMELVHAMPQAAAALAPLIVKTLDIPDADEVIEALKGINQQGNPQQAQQMQQQLQQAHEQLQQMGQKLQAAAQAAQEAQDDQQQKQAELQLRSRELDLKTFEAQTARFEAETDRAKAAHEINQPAPVAQPAAAPPTPGLSGPLLAAV